MLSEDARSDGCSLNSVQITVPAYATASALDEESRATERVARRNLALKVASDCLDALTPWHDMTLYDCSRYEQINCIAGVFLLAR